MVGDELLERLKAEFEGQPYRGPRVGVDPVNLPMIRHFVDAVGDRNPAYVDERFASASRFGGIVSPPAMLQVWTMPGLVDPDDPNDRQPALLDMLDEAGYTSVVATNSEQEYARYLRPGDVVTFQSHVESIVGPKQTALGEGYFITTLEESLDQDGEVVGTTRFRILKFRPGAADASGDGQGNTSQRPRPSINQDNAYFWEGVEAGELRIQRCTQCRRLRHPGQPACRECGSFDWDWIVAAGTGTVYSFVVHHHPPLPGFEPPFVVGLVELEEGARVVAEIVGVEGAEVEVGMPVRLTFTAIDDELTVPQWVPA
ncbi:MAG: OB-fold domain-containing protein [Actinobacteria bacterium]|nr:OB-fold domain-containing protein [Actinomycetota bacterium]